MIDDVNQQLIPRPGPRDLPPCDGERRAIAEQARIRREAPAMAPAKVDTTLKTPRRITGLK